MQKTTVATFSTIMLSLVFASAFAAYTPKAPTIADSNSYVLMAAENGQIIAEKNPDEKFSPASMTKIMTVYLVAQALAEGNIELSDKVTISKKAWKTEGSRMFIKVNSQVPVEDLLSGVVVASGNDATVALAEHIGGTEESFVDLMNQTAQQLGMTNTHFKNSNGLDEADHYSSAEDLAILSKNLIQKYPEVCARFKEKW